jgi:hypothetical protein
MLSFNSNGMAKMVGVACLCCRLLTISEVTYQSVYITCLNTTRKVGMMHNQSRGILILI